MKKVKTKRQTKTLEKEIKRIELEES